MVTATLAIPPSANSQWRITNNRIYKTAKAKQWQEGAAWELKFSAKGQKIPFANAAVKTLIYWPDKRRRDGANLEKLLFDAIQDSGIVEDDKDIFSHTTIAAGVDVKNPRLEIEIRQYAE